MYQYLKTPFRSIFTQKAQRKSFPERESILNLYAAPTLCKKSEKFHAWIFHNT